MNLRIGFIIILTLFPMAVYAAKATCNPMESLDYMPAGYHPISVEWRPGHYLGDYVCIQKTEGDQIFFIPWLGLKLPPNYYILYKNQPTTANFVGCKKWSGYKGDAKCVEVYPSYILKRNAEVPK